LFTNIGLGSTKLNGGGYPTHLLHVDLGYVKQWRCKALYKPLPWIKDSMMCTTVGAKDTLGGDSGGPLYDKENKVLVGLVSWGMDNPKFPGVVSSFNISVFNFNTST
jgi:secreted trypsin-like serine protease